MRYGQERDSDTGALIRLNFGMRDRARTIVKG
jgi:hypothetical protein